MLTMRWLSVVAFVLLAPVAHADVLVVGSGGDYPDLAAAVAAASDGDTILLKDTVVDACTITGKSLTISAFENSGDLTFIAGELVIQGLAAGQSVVLHRLAMSPAFPFGTVNDLVLDDNDGVVWLQQCWFTSPAKTVTARVQDTRLLVLVESKIYGGHGTGTAMTIDDSLVVSHASEIRGGEGLSDLKTATDGGTAVELHSGDLRVMGGKVYGGGGGATEDDGDCGAPGDGGDGIVLGTGTVEVSDDAYIAGGPKGFAFSGCEIGSPTAGDAVVGGVLGELRWDAHGVRSPGLLRQGDTVLLRLYGLPGEAALLLVAFGAKLGPLPPQQVPVVVDVASMFTVALGTLNANGELNIPVAGPVLPPGVENLRIVMQAVFQSGTDHAIGAGSALSLLGAGF